MLHKRLFRLVLILGAAALPTGAPGCSDANGPGCQAEGERCGSNDEPYFNCCAGLDCRTIIQGNNLTHKCVDPGGTSLIEP